MNSNTMIIFSNVTFDVEYRFKAKSPYLMKIIEGGLGPTSFFQSEKWLWKFFLKKSFSSIYNYIISVYGFPGNT